MRKLCSLYYLPFFSIDKSDMNFLNINNSWCESYVHCIICLFSVLTSLITKVMFTALFAFFSIDKVPKITSPVLVIHGTEDEVIDFSHGLAIHERCPRAVEPLWVEGAGHNDVELYSQYLERLKQFITIDLASNWLEAGLGDDVDANRTDGLADSQTTQGDPPINGLEMEAMNDNQSHDSSTTDSPEAVVENNNFTVERIVWPCWPAQVTQLDLHASVRGWFEWNQHCLFTK